MAVTRNAMMLCMYRHPSDGFRRGRWCRYEAKFKIKWAFREVKSGPINGTSYYCQEHKDLMKSSLATSGNLFSMETTPL